MGDDTRASSRAEEQIPEFAVEGLEDVLLHLGRHLTTKEWARIAGTCKASWDCQLTHIELPDCTSVAGVPQRLDGGEQANVDCLGQRISSFIQHATGIEEATVML